MMNNRIYRIKVLIMIVVASLFTNCSKDDDLPSYEFVKSIEGNRNFTYNSNDLLTSRTKNLSYGDIKHVFTYDDQNRVVLWKYIRPTTMGFDESQNKIFTYDDIGRLIDYSISISNESTGDTTDITNIMSFNYNADSSICNVIYFHGSEYNNITLYINNIGFVSKLVSDDFTYYFEYDSDNNLINIHEDGYTYSRDYTIEYDSMVNPFYNQLKSVYLQRIIKIWANGIFSLMYFDGYTYNYNKNNIVRITNDWGVSTYEETRSYKYKNNRPIYVSGFTTANSSIENIEYY